MKDLEKKDVQIELTNEETNHSIQNQLTEVLGEKMFSLEKFYRFLIKRIRGYRNVSTHDVGKDISNLWNQMREDGVKVISESEVRRILKNLNSYLKTKREILREPFTQDIPYFRASWNDRQYYLKKINDRSLPVEEYEKMQGEIEKHGSILSRSNKRNWEFGGGTGDVILSLTTGKVYDVEGEGEKGLEEDYKSRRYYSSRSGLSGAGNIYAGKGSLIYMPSSRMDITYPELYFNDINGLNMTMCTSRGVIDESLPTIIKSGRINLGVDAVFLSQKDHLERGKARDLINTIETKGENLKDWPIYTYKVRYYDENLEEKENVFTYKTNMNPKDIDFRAIGKNFFGIKRGFEVEDTGSFIDKIIGIKKYKGKYVRLGQFGLIKEVFDEHPSSDMDKIYYDDIEIGDKNEIIHKKVEIPSPLGADLTRKFNGWIMNDGFAYKNMKNLGELGKYDLKNICSEHNVEYDDDLVDDVLYHLVYEDNISKYNKKFGAGGDVTMEFEYYVPKTIFEQFSTDYWKNFLNDKLKAKAIDSINISSLSEVTQKNVALNYLKSHLNTIFTLQDSYDSGNCRPGTDRFVDTFGISDKITGRELLKHKDFEKMLSIYDFRKIFIKKALSN